MKKRMFWGLGILILLIGIVSVFFLIPRDTDTEPEMVLGEATKKLLEDRLKQQGTPQEADKPPPPGASPDGHWHNGEWHDTPHPQKPNGVSHKGKQSSLSVPLAFGVTYAELGLEVPPKGYCYVWEKERVPKLDENGDPILLKEGEPYIEILYETGFAPTPEQLNQYMKLKGRYYAARGWGRITEAERLKVEMEEFKAQAQGKVPGAVLISNDYGRDYSEKLKKKQIEAYRKLGLGHLYDYIATGQISH